MKSNVPEWIKAAAEFGIVHGAGDRVLASSSMVSVVRLNRPIKEGCLVTRFK